MPSLALEMLARPLFNASLPDAEWLAAIREAAATDLRPLVGEIDREGLYPRAWMERLGELGGFAQGAPVELGGGGRGLKATLQGMEAVSSECLSTGFCVWCQMVCGWYIQHGASDFLKRQVLPQVLAGARMGATGLSNPMKHFAGIEKINLVARHEPGGYRVSGVLPWVSNVSPEGYFAFVAAVEDGPHAGKYLMAVTPGDAPGVRLGDGGHFIALEGSSTMSARFEDAFVAHDWILAAPCEEYIARVRPGFILGQAGFGLGLVESCVELMKKADKRTAHVNCFLDDRVEHIEANLEEARRFTWALAEEIGTGCSPEPARKGLLRDVVQARLTASELSLRASQAAMLYAGASGYRLGGVPERKLRESYFVAVVTPAMKQLKKMLATLDGAA